MKNVVSTDSLATKIFAAAMNAATQLIVWLVVVSFASLAQAADLSMRIGTRNLPYLYRTNAASYLCYASGRPLRSQLAELKPRSNFAIGGRFLLVNTSKRRNSINNDIRALNRALRSASLSPAKRQLLEVKRQQRAAALSAFNSARQTCRSFDPRLCSNGRQDILELGIDCGGQCQTHCPLLGNPIQFSSSAQSSSSQGSEQPNGGSTDIISSPGSSSSSSGPPAACSDGTDNDHDGLMDMADPGCGGPDDNAEASPCDSYKMLDAVEGALSDHDQLERNGFTRNRVVFLYEGQYGEFPRQFCYQGVCSDYYGVIPQAGIDNLASHLAALRNYVEYMVPDSQFSGWIVSDIEAYSPFSWSRTWFPQLPSIYKTMSRDRVRSRQPELTTEEVEVMAETEFNEAALRLLVESLRLIRSMRPQAKLAMYGYPMALPSDYSWGYTSPIYGDANRQYNDRLEPLWDELDGYTPVIYQHVPLGWRFSSGTTQTYEWSTYWIEAVMAESARLQARFGFKDIVPIVWYRYFDGGSGPYRNQLMSAEDLQIQLMLPLSLGASNVIVWGNEVLPWGSDFANYVTTMAGPQIRSFCTGSS